MPPSPYLKILDPPLDTPANSPSGIASNQGQLQIQTATVEQCIGFLTPTLVTIKVHADNSFFCFRNGKSKNRILSKNRFYFHCYKQKNGRFFIICVRNENIKIKILRNKLFFYFTVFLKLFFQFVFLQIEKISNFYQFNLSFCHVKIKKLN